MYHIIKHISMFFAVVDDVVEVTLLRTLYDFTPAQLVHFFGNRVRVRATHRSLIMIFFEDSYGVTHGCLL